QERRDEDDRLGDHEDLDVDEERPRDLGERVAVLVPVEEVGLELLQPGDCVASAASTSRKTTVLAAAMSAPRPDPERGGERFRIRDRRSPSRAYLRTGAPPTLASQRFCSALIVPFAHRRLSALLTQRRRSLPFSKTMPKCSRVPRLGSWPTILPSSSWTAV